MKCKKCNALLPSLIDPFAEAFGLEDCFYCEKCAPIIKRNKRRKK
jgi:hypothetical protein